MSVGHEPSRHPTSPRQILDDDGASFRFCISWMAGSTQQAIAGFTTGVVPLKSTTFQFPSRLLIRNRKNLEEAMKNLSQKVHRFLVSEDGPTAVEYAVMLALIVIVCITAIQAIGTNANTTFNTMATQLG